MTGLGQAGCRAVSVASTGCSSAPRSSGGSLPTTELDGDGADFALRLGLVAFLEVEGDRLADRLRGFLARVADGVDREVDGADVPASVSGLFVDHGVVSHRSSSIPVSLRIDA